MHLSIRAWTLIMMCVPGVAASQPVETGFLNRSVSIEGSTHRYQVYVPATVKAVPMAFCRPRSDWGRP